MTMGLHFILAMTLMVKNSLTFSCIQDVESYIHRSGRTGRAGRTGVSILFYMSQQEHMIPLVEKKAGVQFQRIGAPQPVDIIKAGARDSVRLAVHVSTSHYTTLVHSQIIKYNYVHAHNA